MSQELWWTAPTESENGKLIMVTGRKDVESFRKNPKFSIRIEVTWKYEPEADGMPDKETSEQMEQVQEILDSLPDDLSEERRQVILTAYQLFGKVNYFWGGKSLVLGWDSRWGTPKEVWAAGSPSTGTVRPYGLDCSGFVDWVFYNISGGTYVIGHGGGAHMQHSYSACRAH